MPKSEVAALPLTEDLLDGPRLLPVQKKTEVLDFGFLKKLAATYSRGVYKTTTIGKTVFDGRVRDGIGSDHSFITTKKL